MSNYLNPHLFSVILQNRKQKKQMKKKYSTKEDFIKDAQLVHGNKYDYSKVEYVNIDTKICIICNNHGEFFQSPYNHLKGHRCPKCAKEYSAKKLRKWTKEKCFEVASQYNEMKDFRTQSQDAYNAALKHNWLKDYTWLAYKIDISKPKKKRQTYSQDDIIERLRSIFGEQYGYEKVVYKAMKVPVTLVCHAKDADGIEHGEFSMRPDNIFSGKQGCPKCYDARRSKLQRKPLDVFVDEARKLHNDLYEYHKVDYINTNTKVCIVCKIHGDFWQTPSNHLKGKGCPYCSGNAKKWNKKTCEKEARKYEYIFDFRVKGGGACNVAQRNGWLKDYTWLKKLPPKTSDYDKDTKYIYAYEFTKQKAVYVGLTNSMIKRDWQHRNNTDSAVYRFAEENRCDVPTPKQLEESIPIHESGKREATWVDYYKRHNWKILNRARTGERESALGASYPLKWNRKTIKEKAKECDYNLTLFMESYPGAYGAILARYKGLLNELFPDRKIRSHHTIEDALLVVKNGNYESRSQLNSDCSWAHRILYKNGLLDDVFGKPKEYTKDEALKEANNYKSIEQIRLKNHPLWNYFKKNNLFREAKPTDRMFRRVKTVEEAWELSLYYKTMTELSNHASKAYSILKENGLLERRYPNSIKYAIKEEFTFEDCKKVYAKCANVSEVEKRYRKIHRVAKEKGWHEELKSYCIGKPKLLPQSNFEDCKKIYAQCSSVSEVKKRYNNIYKVSNEKGWHDKLKSFCTRKPKLWSRSICEDIVKRYSLLIDFIKNEKNAYQAIRRNHWNDLLLPLKRVQHAPYNYTIDEIKEICSHYNNMSELSKSRKDIENYCRKRGIDLYKLNGWKNLVKRPISQILNGVEIATYASISEAARAINVPRNRMWEHIGKEEPYQGYIWKYKDV